MFKSIFKKDIALSDFVLLITAAFIIFYTYETQKMRKQMEKAKEVEVMPVVIFDPQTQNIYYRNANLKYLRQDAFTLRLKNVGKGIAKELMVYMNGCRLSTPRSIESDSESYDMSFWLVNFSEEAFKIFERKEEKINLRLEYKDIYENMFCTETTFDKEETQEYIRYAVDKRWDFYQL